MIRFLIAASLFCIAFAGQAQQVSVPNSFTAGAPAKAADVNANFSALAAGINALSARVAKLEGQITAADLVGTYALKGIQMELGGGAGAHLASYVYTGTLTLAADGTGSLTSTQSGSQLNLAVSPPTRGSASKPAETGVLTWSLSGSSVTALGMNFAVSNGGRMLVAAGANPADGTEVILIITRLN